MGKPVRAEPWATAFRAEELPRESLPEIAVVGRSNVGKSSLLNALCGVRRLARVSKTPGRTQAIYFYRIDGRFVLADLPGYGFARAPRSVRSRWEGLVTAYLFGRPALRLVLLLVDARHEPMESDHRVRALLERAGLPYVVVATKADKLSRAALAASRERLVTTFRAADEEPIVFSAVTKQGRKELWQAIERHVRAATPPPRTR